MALKKFLVFRVHFWLIIAAVFLLVTIKTEFIFWNSFLAREQYQQSAGILVKLQIVFLSLITYAKLQNYQTNEREKPYQNTFGSLVVKKCKKHWSENVQEIKLNFLLTWHSLKLCKLSEIFAFSVTTYFSLKFAKVFFLSHLFLK